MSLSIGFTQASGMRGLPSRLWRAVQDAQKRASRKAALRRELARMDAHMLSDIGVSRAQLLFDIDREG